MQVTLNNNSNIGFSGATRTFRRNYYSTVQEMVDVFEKYPKSDGIAGSLPHSWLKKLIPLPKDERGEKIKTLYRLFRESFGSDNNNLQQISERFTSTLRDLNIIPPENQIIIKKRKLDGKMLRGALTIKERGKSKTIEPLFVKQFIKSSRKHPPDDEGLLPELALGLHLHKIFRNEHIIRPYFSDTKARFMVTKYEITPQNVEIPKELSLSEAFFNIQEHFEKLKKITGDKTDIQALLAKKGFTHNDLKDQNILITKNKKGKLITKLIDLGQIRKNKN